MRRQRERVIRLIMFEIGKTLKDSTAEFDRTVKHVEDTIAALKDLDRTASWFVVEQGFIAQIRRASLGVTLMMGPLNYPLNETFTTLIPALIMGNTVVFKTPKLGMLLCAIAMPRSVSAGALSRKTTRFVRGADHPPRAHAPPHLSLHRSNSVLIYLTTTNQYVVARTGTTKDTQGREER